MVVYFPLARHPPRMAHSRPTFVNPSSITMSELPSATAARMERPSDDQDTLRAMNVARSPKSVIRRHSPVVVESAQRLVVNPSVNACAIHFPSGDSVG